MNKIKGLGGVLDLSAKQYDQFLPIQPIHLENGPNGLYWQCCLAGSSKTAPRILIFSIAMGADNSFEVKNIEIWLPAFFKHKHSSVATMTRYEKHCQMFRRLFLVFFETMNIPCMYTHNGAIYASKFPHYFLNWIKSQIRMGILKCWMQFHEICYQSGQGQGRNHESF